MEKAKRFPQLLVAVAAALALSLLALTGCSGGGSSSEDKTITIAAVPTPHAEILNDVVKPALEKEGYTLEVKEFTDYVLPNTATEQEEVDANYFQHKPYLDNFNEEQGTLAFIMSPSVCTRPNTLIFPRSPMALKLQYPTMPPMKRVHCCCSKRTDSSSSRMMQA